MDQTSDQTEDQGQTLTLCCLSLAMFLGSYLAGLIPLVLSLSERILRIVTVFGAGLLIGTALTVIIPEGIESLYTSDIDFSELKHAPPTEAKREISSQDDIKKPAIHLTGIEEELNNMNRVKEIIEAHELYLGLSLVIGFIFMLIIDQLTPHSSHVSIGLNGNSAIHNNKSGITATVGLVVHAAADGLALGAAAGLSKADIELIIFVAIMLHKAPAAFGFTTFLIHEGLDKRSAKCHLLIFSLAAPISSFITYFGLIKIMYTSNLPLTGIAMLFSAGTFLYVATVHVLNEVTHVPNSEHRLSKTEVIVIVFGSLAPLAFNFVHSH